MLAAPALLDQERLAKLIENNGVTKVKKIIIFQSERDILYLLVIGSASKYPLQWKLFENQTIAGKVDILVDTDNLSGIAVSPTDSIFVHGALRDKMVSTFYHGDYPFDGRFEGLKKKDCVQGSK